MSSTIRYRCPRCKKALESPASAAGTTSACTDCGQRLQIPAPPQSPPPVPKIVPPAVEPFQAQLSLPESSGVSAQAPRPRQPDILDDDVADVPIRKERGARRETCRECGRDISASERVRNCPDCDAQLCSRECARDHQEHVHGGRRPSENSTGMALTGMILGIVGFVLAFIPCIGWVFGIILGILGAVFGSIGIAQAGKSGQGKGMAVTGLVMSILAIIWGPLVHFLIFAAVGAGAGAAAKAALDDPRFKAPAFNAPGIKAGPITPIPLAAGGTFEGQITIADRDPSGPGFAKVYTYKMTANQNYTINLDSNQFDAFLRVEDSKGTVLAQDDDSGGDRNAMISFSPTKTDEYRIIATSLGGIFTGSYTLRVRP